MFVDILIKFVLALLGLVFSCFVIVILIVVVNEWLKERKGK